jgi:hypothetical protein
MTVIARDGVAQYENGVWHAWRHCDQHDTTHNEEGRTSYEALGALASWDCHVQGQELDYGLKATIEMNHWHIIHGGIEFEDANGAFVHILMTKEQWSQVADHMLRGYRAV